MNIVRDRLLRKGDYVYGSFVKPEVVDGFINGVNPGDRKDVLGRFPFSEMSVNEAVGFAREGFRQWRRVPLHDRANAVRRFRDQVARYQEQISQLVTRETGKPIWESRQEVLATIRAMDLFLDEGADRLAPHVLDELGARSDRMPRGIVAMLTPYTFPVLLAGVQSAAAVLAGDVVVYKPSKFTPGVGQLLAELWDGCRLPRGVINMVQGPGAVVGQRLVQHPDLDVLLFTGRYETARAIRQLTTSRVGLPMMLHCGGKACAIVLEDAEPDRAVYEVMVGAFLTAGQRHNSTARVIVTEGIFDTFVDRLVRQTARINVGYGFDHDTFLGPLISENLRTRYRRFTRLLTKEGHDALIEAGPERCERRGFYARPAIYKVNWSQGEPFLGESPPGPTVLLYKVSGWEEAVALHNQIGARIATSIFTDPYSHALEEMRFLIRTGTLNINRGTIGSSNRLSSVGVGTSSNGVAGGLELLAFLTQSRAELVESRAFRGLPVLPGTNWSGLESMDIDLDTDDEELDLNRAMELP